jgi:TPR repeat protein
MRLVRGVLAAWLLICAGETVARAQEPAAEAPPSVQEIEKKVAELRAHLHAHPETPQGWGMLTMTEVMLLRTRMFAEANGAEPDQALLAEKQRAIVLRVREEWKAALPNDPTPYLQEMNESVPPAQRDDFVMSLRGRFPDDRGLLQRAVDILIKRDQGAQAEALVMAALAQHPDDSSFWRYAVSFFGQRNNEAKVRALTESWIERMPGDSGALEAFLNSGILERDPETSHARLERMLAMPPFDAARVNQCRLLLQRDTGRYRDLAERCLAEAERKAEAPSVRASAGAASVAASARPGSADDLARALAAMAPAERPAAVMQAASALPEGACTQRTAFIRLLPWDGTAAGGPPQSAASTLSGCERDPAAREFFLQLIASAPLDQLTSVLSYWFPRVNGVFRDPGPLGARLVETVEGRAHREPGARGMREALAAVYEMTGEDERRAALLEAWLQEEPQGPNAEQVAWLATYQENQDDDSEGPSSSAGGEKALDTLRASWKAGNTRALDALSERLLERGRSADLEALSAELAARQDSDSTAWAHLLEARALLATGKTPVSDRVLAEYEAYLHGLASPLKDAAREYVAVVGGRRGLEAATAAAAAVCEHESVRLNTTGSACSAEFLAELGASSAGLGVLEEAAGRSPNDIPAQLRYAQAASASGRDDAARAVYRRILALDPESTAAFSGLARIAERHNALGDAEALVRESARLPGGTPSDVSIVEVHLLRKAGQARRAVLLLEELRRRNPSNWQLDEELLEARAELAHEAPPPAAVAAPAIAGHPQKPTAAELAAMREAEGWLTGLDRPIDTKKAQALIVEQASAGSLYGIARLAINLRRGVLGEPDPQKANATAGPYIAQLKAIAESGDSYAEYLYGTLLLMGVGVPAQPAAALPWLQKAAERGEPGAIQNLGWMSVSGTGVPKDVHEAARWYRRGAEAGNTRSMYDLALLLFLPDGPLHNPPEGVPFLRQAAERGDPDSVAWWAALQLYGFETIAPDPVRARPWLERAAALEEPRGRFDLAASLLTGVGGPRDTARAVTLLEQNAAHGHSRSMVQLVWQCALGEGIPRDPDKAAAWIERAASLGIDDFSMVLGGSSEDGPMFRAWFEKDLAELERRGAAGDAFAGGLAARLYWMGQGVLENKDRALALARPAAAAGSTEAMRTLGRAFHEGIGLKADVSQAALWWRRCGDRGNSYCMVSYARMLLKGETGEIDLREGMKWFERAGEAGNGDAIFQLGRAYDEGWYEPRNETKAAYWKRKAAKAGSDEARGWMVAHGLKP